MKYSKSRPSLLSRLWCPPSPPKSRPPSSTASLTSFSSLDHIIVGLELETWRPASAPVLASSSPRACTPTRRATIPIPPTRRANVPTPPARRANIPTPPLPPTRPQISPISTSAPVPITRKPPPRPPRPPRPWSSHPTPYWSASASAIPSSRTIILPPSGPNLAKQLPALPAASSIYSTRSTSFASNMLPDVPPIPTSWHKDPKPAYPSSTALPAPRRTTELLRIADQLEDMERLLAAQRVIISRLLREEMEGGGELEDGVVGGFDVLGEMVGEVLGEFERCGWRGRAEGSGCGEMTPPMSPQDGGWRRPMIV